MEKSILSQKDFHQSSSPDTLAAETKVWISRIKRHIETTNCPHCKKVLNNIEAGDQPTSSDYAAHNHNPTGKLGSECYNG